ncbi:MAG: hypothetical protein D6759_09470 [Chloroflexi bacterium]|nr:MAG: hypothetical protein D6759_09470 [Chloroflexota bacterium]
MMMFETLASSFFPLVQIVALSVAALLAFSSLSLLLLSAFSVQMGDETAAGGTPIALLMLVLAFLLARPFV